jgi:hypothetical protein
MSGDGWSTIAVVVATFVALLKNWVPPDLLFLAGSALLASLVISPKEAFACFANEAC